jgi:hypothetical protein
MSKNSGLRSPSYTIRLSRPKSCFSRSPDRRVYDTRWSKPIVFGGYLWCNIMHARRADNCVWYVAAPLPLTQTHLVSVNGPRITSRPPPRTLLCAPAWTVIFSTSTGSLKWGHGVVRSLLYRAVVKLK